MRIGPMVIEQSYASGMQAGIAQSVWHSPQAVQCEDQIPVRANFLHLFRPAPGSTQSPT